MRVRQRDFVGQIVILRRGISRYLAEILSAAADKLVQNDLITKNWLAYALHRLSKFNGYIDYRADCMGIQPMVAFDA